MDAAIVAYVDSWITVKAVVKFLTLRKTTTFIKFLQSIFYCNKT